MFTSIDRLSYNFTIIHGRVNDPHWQIIHMRFRVEDRCSL